MDFKKAVNIIFKHEGYYSNDINDPGGETKYGISKRSYPELDIKNLTKGHAKFIYENDFWNACKCSGLPEKIRLAVFDCAVNQGVSFSSKTLQKVVGAKVDGQIGPKTLSKTLLMDDEEILIQFLDFRLVRYFKNENFDIYGMGWVRRLLMISSETRR